MADKFDAKGRSAARMAAVQALYELDMVKTDENLVLQALIDKHWSITLEDEDGYEIGEADFNDPDKTFLIALVRGVQAKKASVDEMIEGTLGEKWTVPRLEVLLRAMLRAGAYELAEHGDIPAKVIINEYMDIANAFFTEGEPKMVNGVLDKLAHVLRDGRLD
ncbi:MAG: transcription antitermination factor NusB [Rhodospirillaceae bacterium]|nr:MAG: transcription antitermination factor NusB [Rhodospirillaceae bacterium]